MKGGNDKDWIDVVRQKAERGSSPVPHDSWDAISKALTEKKRDKVVVLRHRRVWLTAAAVAAMLLVVAGYLLKHPAAQITPAVSREAVTAQLAVHQQADKAYGETPVAAAPVVARTAVPASGRVSPVKKTASPMVAEVLAPVSTEAETASEVAVGGKNKSEERKPVSEKPEEKSHRHEMPVTGNDDWLAELPRKREVSDDGGVSIGVYGGGAMSSGKMNASSENVYAMSAMPSGVFMAYPRMPKYEYHHKQPITVGVTVRKGLPYGFGVSAGVNYKVLDSDVTDSNLGEELTQRLKFIGIPVGIDYRVLRFKKFVAYVGVEGEAERCVEARFGNEKSTIKRVQWSMHGKLRAEMEITEHFGVYVEPKVSHYFTKLPLTTIRDEHPLGFNLQFGLSLNY